MSVIVTATGGMSKLAEKKTAAPAQAPAEKKQGKKKAE